MAKISPSYKNIKPSNLDDCPLNCETCLLAFAVEQFETLYRKKSLLKRGWLFMSTTQIVNPPQFLMQIT